MENLTGRSVSLLRLLLIDDDIRSILIDRTHNEVYKSTTICENGDIVLGKTYYKWWNRFLGCEKTISFTEFTFHAVTALSKKEAINGTMRDEGLISKIIDTLIKKGKVNQTVDILFDVARYGVRSALSTEGFSINNNVKITTKYITRRSGGSIILPGSGEPLAEVVVVDDD